MKILVLMPHLVVVWKCYNGPGARAVPGLKILDLLVVFRFYYFINI
jgi:hypothetical protein